MKQKYKIQSNGYKKAIKMFNIENEKSFFSEHNCKKKLFMYNLRLR